MIKKCIKANYRKTVNIPNFNHIFRKINGQKPRKKTGFLTFVQLKRYSIRIMHAINNQIDMHFLILHFQFRS